MRGKHSMRKQVTALFWWMILCVCKSKFKNMSERENQEKRNYTHVGG